MANFKKAYLFSSLRFCLLLHRVYGLYKETFLIFFLETCTHCVIYCFLCHDREFFQRKLILDQVCICELLKIWILEFPIQNSGLNNDFLKNLTVTA